MTASRSELRDQIATAEWAYMLAPSDAPPAQLCELIVTALAAGGFLRDHAPTPGYVSGLLATTVEGWA